MSKWLEHARHMWGASGHGAFFPRGPAPAAAPGGSWEQPTHGRPLHRLRREVNWFRPTEHNLHIPALSEKITVLHLTDIHLRKPGKWLDSLCDAIDNGNPDLLVITGDIVAKGWTTEALNQFLSALPEAKLGKWAVLGNWEHWVGPDKEQWRTMLSAHGVVLLHNEQTTTGPIRLAGTDDALAGTAPPPDLIPRDGIPTIILSHSPCLFPELVQDNVALVLSGHAHGGQIRLPLLGALWVPRGTDVYVAGWYKHENTWLFVSRGIGWSVAPMRMRCPPEIARITLHPSISD